jgi:hypothetical protein
MRLIAGMVSWIRKIRIEFAGAFHHVINRGNYRSGTFRTKGARGSFLECLKLVCRAQGWRLHASDLMRNLPKN